MTRKLISLDIRNDRVAALLIKNSLKGNWIEAISTSSISYVSKNIDENENPLEPAIDKVMNGIDTAGAEFLVSISPELISYRNLRIPFKDKKKIRQVLPFEIEPTLPFPIEDVIINFQAVRQTDQTDILSGVIKSSDLTAILDILKKRNIDPIIVTPGGLPIATCLSRLADLPPQSIFLDLNHNSCSLFAISSGQIYLARSFPISGTNPTDKLNIIIRNIYQFLAAFESFYEFNYNPSLICISGIEDDPNGFAQQVEHLINIPIKQMNILNHAYQNIHLSDGITFLPDQFNNALSLAVAEISGIDMINFYGERSIFRRYWEEYKNDIIKTGFFATVVFICFMFNLLLEAHYLAGSIRQLNQQITSIFQTTFPDVTRIVDPVLQMKQLIQEAKGKSSYAGQIEDIKPNIDILNDISQLIPQQIDTVITQFARGEDNILISGDTDTFNAVNEIKSNLEKSKYFKNITINSANMDAALNRIQFKLKIDL